MARGTEATDKEKRDASHNTPKPKAEPESRPVNAATHQRRSTRGIIVDGDNQ
jgi:hypothetical protein